MIVRLKKKISYALFKLEIRLVFQDFTHLKVHHKLKKVILK